MSSKTKVLMAVNFERRLQIFYLYFLSNVSMLLLINFREKIAYQRSNPTNPVIIKTAFKVSSTARMLSAPASVVFLLSGLPEWHNKPSVEQKSESKKTIKAGSSFLP